MYRRPCDSVAEKCPRNRNGFMFARGRRFRSPNNFAVSVEQLDDSIRPALTCITQHPVQEYQLPGLRPEYLKRALGLLAIVYRLPCRFFRIGVACELHRVTQRRDYSQARAGARGARRVNWRPLGDSNYRYRRKRGGNGGSLSARSGFKMRREPCWRSLSPGFALGYRKLSTGGTSIARQ
jgi:hypothetical protein